MQLRRPLALAAVVLPLLACGSSAPGKGGANAKSTAPVAMMTCPAPIGPVPKEDCGEIADDFGALQVDGALQVAGDGRDAAPKLEAIRAVSALAASIKDQRVTLCEAYVTCTVPATAHATRNPILAR